MRVQASPSDRPSERTRWVCDRARSIGFDLCGVAPVHGLRELDRLPEWLSRGYAGEMKYLHDPRRSDPALVLDNARSLIVLALNYNSPHAHSTSSAGHPGDASPRAWISRYAWGDDYHDVVKKKLDALLQGIRAEYTERFEARAYVDTGPIIERIAAKYAGLGWLAKNTMLINQRLGSWLFLGVIVTTLDLEPTLASDQPPAPDLCGSCTRCLDACPTRAFPQPYVLDSRRCISYLSIELRGSIPESLRPGMGHAAVGCDICQDVCPWNRKAPVTSLAAFQPRNTIQLGGPESERADGGLKDVPEMESSGSSRSLLAPELEWLASLTQLQFSRIFRGSAVKRTKWRGLVRNACIALGNSRIDRDAEFFPRILELLRRLASSDDVLIAEHARWALHRIVPKHGQHPASAPSE